MKKESKKTAAPLRSLLSILPGGIAGLLICLLGARLTAGIFVNTVKYEGLLELAACLLLFFSGLGASLGQWLFGGRQAGFRGLAAAAFLLLLLLTVGLLGESALCALPLLLIRASCLLLGGSLLPLASLMRKGKGKKARKRSRLKR